MQITHVRNATMLIEAAGLRILVDPMLGAKGSGGAAPTTAEDKNRNPLVDLKTPLAELVNVDAVIVTHSHPDHWDEAAASLLPREVPIVVQNGSDARMLGNIGFTNAIIMDSPVIFGQATVTRTEGQHGTDEFMAATPEMGPVSGFVLNVPGEPTVYVAGDTVWHHGVVTALNDHKPDLVVLNTGEATWAGGDAIIMGAKDVLRVHETLPSAQIIAVHMEALNHCVVTREQVRGLAAEQGIADLVHVPADGEKMVF
ncbi:MBL fold metallo-hydrolase [Paenarthrobacter nitroguajacolicus]|uniref:MBL fold metallo-hydrolase n=1 Tax=Paenarthrobacter nitroguajacolicus TaxID=211146 RepID=UPI00343FEF86